MLFNSEIFILLFVPATLLVYYGLAAHNRPRQWCLIAASLLFYGYWDIRFLPLLFGSAVGNWLLLRWFARSGGGAGMHRSLPLIAVLFNLLLIGIFKYADFIAGTLAVVGLWSDEPIGIILPLGISFYTFQQISYAVDLHRAARDGKSVSVHGFREYLLFVSFFPQLVAGPIVRHNEIIPQFRLDPRRPGLEERLARGGMLFLVGLGKKVLIADVAARIGSPMFNRVLEGGTLNLGEAWLATYAYFLQLYFDFSGYSDMAIGLGLMFGFLLPINFNAPYRATSIQDFWRRWHMTLSRFLRDYLYIPFGGNRGGILVQMRNSFLTMLLGGLWHGAAWSYVVWGGAHGLAVGINGLWRHLGLRMPALLGWVCTMGFVVASWILFRTEDFAATWSIYKSWFGLHGHGGTTIDSPLILAALVAGGIAAFAGPTSQKFILDQLRPSRWVGLFAALALVGMILLIGGGLQSEFIYFQF